MRLINDVKAARFEIELKKYFIPADKDQRALARVLDTDYDKAVFLAAKSEKLARRSLKKIERMTVPAKYAALKTDVVTVLHHTVKAMELVPAVAGGKVSQLHHRKEFLTHTREVRTYTEYSKQEIEFLTGGKYVASNSVLD